MKTRKIPTLVKEIAEKHGGNAWAESTPGHGATFYISISKDLH
jgi:signal transduction histidine kinase